jgi:hypothetical protein
LIIHNWAMARTDWAIGHFPVPYPDSAALPKQDRGCRSNREIKPYGNLSVRSFLGSPSPTPLAA